MNPPQKDIRVAFWLAVGLWVIILVALQWSRPW